MDRTEMERLAKDEGMRQRRDAISDPLRLRVLGLLSEADGLTAKELAERLGMNPNRLYYHLRILEKARVIVVADTRAVGRMVERVYKPVDVGRYIWDPEEPIQMVTNLGAILEVNRLGAEEALYKQARRIEAGEEPPIVTWSAQSFATTREEIVEFTKRVDALQAEFRERAKRRARRSVANGPAQQSELKFTWLVYEQPIAERSVAAEAPVSG